MSEPDLLKPSSNVAGLRAHFSKNSNSKKTTAVTSGGPDAVDKQMYGFHPLRSLRNIFFGYRNKSRRLSSMNASKAKSTEDLTAIRKINTDGEDNNDSSGEVVVAAKANDARKSSAGRPLMNVRDMSCLEKKRRSVPYKQMLSISADDLLETSEWSCSDKSSKTRSRNSTDDKGCSSQKARTDGVDADNSQEQSSDETQDFFEEKWASNTDKRERKRNLSEGGATHTLNADSFGIFDSKNSLDVSVVKNKLAVKQKGKRPTTILQQKMAAAEQSTQRNAENRRSIINTGNCAVTMNAGDSLNGSLIERHDIDSGTESTQDDETKTDNKKMKTQLEDACIQSDVMPKTLEATTVDPDKKASYGINKSKKLPISSENLASIIRRTAAAHNLPQDAAPSPGHSTTKPNTPTKPAKAARVAGNEPCATASSKTQDNGMQDGGRLAAETTRKATTTETNKNEFATKDDTPKRCTPGITKSEESLVNNPIKLSTLTPARQISASAAASVETRAITDKTKKPKTRPKTMTPLTDLTSSEPSWMAELAAKKKSRDLNANSDTSM